MLGGEIDGQLRTIVKLQSTDQQLSFTFSRKQFPLALAFANKSQGQSFDTVGVDLRTPVFTHGQFYVAALRVTSKVGLCILLPPDTTKTSNVVYPEILQSIAYFRSLYGYYHVIYKQISPVGIRKLFLS